VTAWIPLARVSEHWQVDPYVALHRLQSMVKRTGVIEIREDRKAFRLLLDDGVLDVLRDASPHFTLTVS
jgi:hypothetical protein